MIKKAKKSVAVGLSVALAVTSVNIPVNSASAAAKKAKLSATKKTLTAGKSTTLTLKTNKKKAKTIKSIKAKYVKVSTSKKSVATVKKVSKKSKFTGIKVTAKKAGKSTITVKVTKGTYKGTYKCTVTVKKKASATKAPTKAPTTEPTVAPTAEPTVAPTAEPTVAPTAEPATTPAITQAPIVQDVEKVDAIVTNSVKGYSNTVLAGQDATIQVKVTDKQGEPVANDNVVLRFEEDTATAGKYEEKSLVVATTNSKGIATFVVGPTKSNVKNTDNSYLGSYKFKITEATENIVAEGKLNVATISYASTEQFTKHWWEFRTADVLNLNGTSAYNNNLVPGANSAKTESNAGYVSQITNIAGGNSQYVGAQQVSTASEDHKVAFKTAVYLNIPSETKKQDKVTSYVQKVNQKSDSYDTYATKTLKIPYDIKDMANVEYATLAFNSVNVSKYTKLVVKKYKGDAIGTTLETYGSNTKSFKQSNFGLQIAKTDLEGSDGLYLEITSKGQVNADNNAGFDVKDLTYVYDQKSVVNGDKVLLKNTSIKWETATPVYSKEETVSAAEKTALGLDRTDYASVTKTVPVFPYVGNAIIKCYNANGSVARYYACATQNEMKASSYTNVNVLDTTKAENFYVISEDEATKSVGAVTDKGDGTVEVDSTQTGTTYLVGTIACDDENVSIDAKNEKVYTSVMWNPVAAKKATVERASFAAAEGQSVTFTAQLVDSNNNPVSVPNAQIEWSGLTGEGVANITTEEVTNTKGQAIAKVSAASVTSLKGISAKDKSGKYNVVLLLGDKKVSLADLYWVELGLKYNNSAIDGVEKSTLDAGVVNGSLSVAADAITVGETWKYAAQLDVAMKGYDSNYKVVEVSGIKFNVAKSSDSKVGTVDIKDSIATVTSNANGIGAIINKLDSSVVTKDGTIKLVNKYNPNLVDTLQFVGEGTPNLDEELTINYSFGVTTGYTASFVNPLSQNAVTGAPRDVYIKVVDNKGNAKADIDVVFTKITSDGTKTTEKVKTNANGIATVSVDSEAAGKSTTVTAKAGDLKEISTIVNWKEAVGFKATGMSYDAATKTIKLSFNSDVYANSVIKEQFAVNYTLDALNKTYSVEKVTVSGKDVVLTLPASATIDWANEAVLKVTVKADATVDPDNGLKYSVVASKTGETITAGNYYTLTGAGTFAELDSTGANVADKATAQPIITAIKAANTVAKFDTAYADYEKATASVKKLVEAEVTNLLDLKTASDDLKKAATAADTVTKAASTYTNGAALKSAVGTAVSDATVTVATDKDTVVDALTPGDVVVTLTKGGLSTTKTITLV